MNQDKEHNNPPDENISILDKIVEVIKEDQEMAGDEAQVWLALGYLWNKFGISYNPSIDLLMSICKRSERFIKGAIKKLRDRLLISIGRAEYTPGDRVKDALYAFSQGNICPKEAIYAQSEDANNAQVQNMHLESANNAQVQNMHLESANNAQQNAQCAQQSANNALSQDFHARANIDNNNINIYNNNQLASNARAHEDAITSLNGNASHFVNMLAGWLSRGVLPPDPKKAEDFLRSLTSTYNVAIVKKAMVDTHGKVAEGEILTNPISFLRGACQRLSDDGFGLKKQQSIGRPGR